MKQTDKITDYYKFSEEICEKLRFPQDAAEEFLSVERKINETPELSQALNEQVFRFCENDSVDMNEIIPEAEKLSEKFGINSYTLNFILIMHCAYYTRLRYKEENLPDSLFLDGLADMKYKLSECREIKGVNGTFVAGWYEGFLRVGRFTLGRFQYEPCGLYEDEDKKLECGYILKNGTRFLNMHIPNSGVSLTDDVRSSSYELAYDYFREWVGGDTVLIQTNSWLLYPRTPEFLPEKSNIIKFMKDFDIVKWVERDEFSDAWRVFGKSAQLPPEDWDENTSLQRAYKKWILSGNKSGYGTGFVVMHKGKNVTHIKEFFA